MPVLKAYHRYVNRDVKKNQYIAEVTPMSDIEVPEKMFKEYIDETKNKIAK